MRGLLVLGLSTLLLSACGSHEVVRPTVSVSIGQQLIDLKQAQVNGALSQSEYERQRRLLINSVE